MDGKHLNLESSLVRAAVVLLIAGQDESFFSAVQAKTNLESAGASGEVHSWHLMLPTSASVALAQAVSAQTPLHCKFHLGRVEVCL